MYLQHFVWTDNTLMGLIQSQHKYTLRKVGRGLFKPPQTEITVKQELSGDALTSGIGSRFVKMASENFNFFRTFPTFLESTCASDQHFGPCVSRMQLMYNQHRI